MSDDEIKQRIKYLVEHGGLYDDPLEEIRKRVRILSYLVATALALNVMHVVTNLI